MLHKIGNMATARRSLQETIVSVGAVSEQSTASVQEVAAMTGERERISVDLAAHAGELASLSDRVRSRLVRFEV